MIRSTSVLLQMRKKKVVGHHHSIFNAEQSPKGTSISMYLVSVYVVGSVSKFIGDNNLQVLLEVRDIIPRVAVQRLLQTLLVQEVADETNATTKHEQAVQAAVLNLLIGFL